MDQWMVFRFLFIIIRYQTYISTDSSSRPVHNALTLLVPAHQPAREQATIETWENYEDLTMASGG